MSPPLVSERFDRMGIADGGLLRYWGAWLPEPPPQPNDPAVLDWVRACEPRPLVIVDSKIAFHGGNENDAGETRAFMQQCRTAADLGATVLVVHHDGKSETSKDYRGVISSAGEDLGARWLRGMWGVLRNRNALRHGLCGESVG